MVRLGFKKIIRQGEELGCDARRPGKKIRIEYGKDLVTESGDTWSHGTGQEPSDGNEDRQRICLDSSYCTIHPTKRCETLAYLRMT